MNPVLRKPAAAAITLVALVAAFFLYSNHPARSSDHQDSPLMVQRPGADITDVFVFPSPTNPANVVLAMDVHPLIPAGQGKTAFFDPGVMYQLKVDYTDDRVEDLVMQFKANGAGPGQTITMYGPGAPRTAGTQSSWIQPVGDAPYDRATTLKNGVKLFAGPREDPFYFDLAQFFKIAPDRNWKNQPNPPPPSASCFRPKGEAQDFLVGYNVLTIAVEVPREMIAPGKINVWATTSLPTESDSSGTYTQVERLGRPAVKEAFELFKRHDTTNRSAPSKDPLLPSDIKAFMMSPPPLGAGRSEAIADAMVKLLIPDEIEADLSARGPARYLAVETTGKSGFPVAVVRAVPPGGIYGIKKALGDPYRHFGGRDPRSPVIDLSLGAIFGSLIPKLGFAPDDHRETPCLTSDSVTPSGKKPLLAGFPYFSEPR